MTALDRPPVASDSPEDLADWLEIQAVLGRPASIESLVRAFRRAGSVDATIDVDDGDHARRSSNDDDDDEIGDDDEGETEEMDRHDRGSERTQAIAEAAFAEIESRDAACAGKYPFKLGAGSITLGAVAEQSAYAFLLLLSAARKPTAGHDGTAVLFENICAYAAQGYMGGADQLARVFRMGAPRRKPLHLLADAIDKLCTELGEGQGCINPERAKHTGDEQLDIVAWRQFADRRAGKLILFGQCAAGRAEWESKVSEMDAVAFTKKWFGRPLLVEPVRIFFVPWRVSDDAWTNTTADAGIVFDRCRIAACVGDMKEETKKSQSKAVASLMKGMTSPAVKPKTKPRKRRAS